MLALLAIIGLLAFGSTADAASHSGCTHTSARQGTFWNMKDGTVVVTDHTLYFEKTKSLFHCHKMISTDIQIYRLYNASANIDALMCLNSTMPDANTVHVIRLNTENFPNSGVQLLPASYVANQMSNCNMTTGMVEVFMRNMTSNVMTTMANTTPSGGAATIGASLALLIPSVFAFLLNKLRN